MIDHILDSAPADLYAAVRCRMNVNAGAINSYCQYYARVQRDSVGVLVLCCENKGTVFAVSILTKKII